MIDPELLVHHLDRRHWAHWWSLLVPPRAWAPALAIAVVEDQGEASPLRHRLLRVVIAGGARRGPVALSTISWRGTHRHHLAELARALGVPAVIVLERRALAALSQQIEPLLRWDQDFLEQGLIALRAFKHLDGAGVWSYPEVLSLLPAPHYDGVQRTFDLLIPDDSAMLCYVIEDDRRRVHASVIARKRRGNLDLVTTHRALEAQLPEATLARHWETEIPRVLAATQAQIAKPSLGIFLERATVRRILTGPSDQLSRELSAKRVILDPAPTWLLGLLGGATVAAVAGRGAKVLAAMLPSAARGRASELAQRATAVMRESGVHPFALLGFDPLELWETLRAVYRQ